MTTKTASLDALRHSVSHIMAQVILEQLPGATLAIGGYQHDREEIYYALDLPRSLARDEFPSIEARMREIIVQSLPFVQRYMSVEDATQLFRTQPYKLEVIEDIAAGRGGYDEASEFKTGNVEPRISTFQHGSFIDVCAGPHITNTREIDPEAFRLTRTETVRWRYKDDNPLLHRVYLTAFGSKAELESHRERTALLEAEYEQRRHDVLGPRLGVVLSRDQGVPDPERGSVPLSVWASGSPFFLPKGAIVYNLLVDYMRSLYRKYGYQEVITPEVFSWRLFELSGHAQVYVSKMYHFDIEGNHVALKPMNCPGHALMYASTRRSYKELPLRLADFGRLHRLEPRGVLHGIMRTRSFAQDDSHIFCRPDQIKQEVQAFISMYREVYGSFFDMSDVRIRLSTRPDAAERVGDDATWEHAETVLEGILRDSGLDFSVGTKEGAFYGPKIDFDVRDALGRWTQLATIQLDYSLPERLRLEYVTSAGIRERPVILHRAVLGSIERFIGVLIEHTGGAFPLWLAPTQVEIIPVTDKHVEYASSVASRLEAEGLRVEVDDRGDRMQAKIRNAQIQKIPYMLVVGDREVRDNTVSVRLRTGGEPEDQPLGGFIERVKAIVSLKQKIL